MSLLRLLEQMIEARERMHVNATMLNSWIKTLGDYAGEELDEEE